MVRKLLASSSLLFFTAISGNSANAAQQPLAVDAMAFGARDSVDNMDLSPDGRRIVYVGPGPGKMSIVFVGNLADGSVKPILKSSGDPESLSWCAFATNDRLACRYVATRDEGILIGYRRMISLNIDGSDVKELGQRSSEYDARVRQFDGAIIDWLPGDGESVLMTRDFIAEAGKMDSNRIRSEDGLGVVKINVQTGKTQTIERASQSASDFMSDGIGNVRLMTISEVTPNYQLTGRRRYQYRKAGSDNWQMLVDYQKDDFYPLAIDASIDSLYALKAIDGRYALIRVKLDDSLAMEVVASNPKVDIDDVVRAGRGQRVIGYTYADDRRRVVYFDPEYKKLSSSLGKALPNLPLVNFVSASNDSQKVLLFAGGDSDPGRYYLYDKSSRSLGEVVQARPELARHSLASVKAINYPAADGTQIPAYLTLPAGSTGKGLPAVVLPHGGPAARDEWGFDWLAQFLASRGYAVIQPNYRGSAGYGEDWLVENGFKSWRTSVGDVSSAAKWLAAQGIADSNRIAIVGWSYGGYAALQSAVTDPALYKAVVAIAPVTDLDLVKREDRHYTNSRMTKDYIGSGSHIAEGSPLRHASQINAPVILFHGDMDQNVGIVHSRKMQAALRDAGKSSELVEFKGLQHSLVDNDARRQVLTKIGELLERTIGQ